MVKVSDSLFLRKVITEDEQLLFLWANDPETRKWSFNSNTIGPGEHKEWFKTRLNAPNVLMLMLEHENKPAGLIRFEKDDNQIILNYLIAPGERGKGLASTMLKMAIDIKQEYWGNIKVLAFTLHKNVASKRSLEKAGFILKNSTTEKYCYEFIKN